MFFFLLWIENAFRELAKKFDVSGIPALIIVKADGSIVTKNGRQDVQNKPPKSAFSSWKA